MEPLLIRKRTARLALPRNPSVSNPPSRSFWAAVVFQKDDMTFAVHQTEE